MRGVFGGLGLYFLHIATNRHTEVGKEVQTHSICERTFKTRGKLLTNMGFCGIMKLYACVNNQNHKDDERLGELVCLRKSLMASNFRK